VRDHQEVDQVFDYPKFQNMPILKIIDDELRNELEVKDDISAEESN
jgi:hypothetical protein